MDDTMYTKENYRDAEKSFWLRVTVNALILLVFLAAMIVGLTLRVKWLVILSAVLGGWACYAYLMFKTLPWGRYRAYLADIKSGLSHESDARFLSVSDDTRLCDGVAMHDFVVSVGDLDDAQDERLFYWDDDKPLPKLQKGQALHIRSFGNYILELKA